MSSLDDTQPQRIADLPGLGPKSAEMLRAAGIHSRDDLARYGALDAWIRVRDLTDCRPSMNLLYALVGALENRHWQDVARTDRLSLALAVESHPGVCNGINGTEAGPAGRTGTRDPQEPGS